MQPNIIPAFRHSSSGKNADAPAYQPYTSLDRTFLEYLCDQGDPGAMEAIAECRFYGIKEEENQKEVVELFRRAAEAGHQDAMFMLADCYMRGNGVEQSYELYFQWLEKAAKAGSWMAAKNMATAYFHGKARYDGFGFDQDDAKALEWSIQAARLATFYWRIYSQGDQKEFEDDLADVFDNFVSLCDVIARHYQTGRGTPVDKEKALEWLNRGNSFVRSVNGGKTLPYLDKRIKEL